MHFRLYTALGRQLDERSVLLLYNLLHSCQRFRNYLHVCGYGPNACTNVLGCRCSAQHISHKVPGARLAVTVTSCRLHLGSVEAVPQGKMRSLTSCSRTLPSTYHILPCGTALTPPKCT